jgi:hypothetical protein
MKLKRLEDAADSALKIEQEAAVGLAQAEKGYKAATARVSAAEAALRHARRELRQAKKAAKSAKKAARKASKRVAKARRKAKRKAQQSASPSGARNATTGVKASSRMRVPKRAATRIDRSPTALEIRKTVAPAPLEPPEPQSADTTV